MKITAEPRSDQWNADDFVGGPRMFTVAGVKVGAAEQKYDVELVEGEGRAWRPPLTVLRLLIEAWGDDATTWVGRRVELYRDESIRFGSDAVGGIRILRMSHLPGNKPLTVKLTMSRGRRASTTVDPLPDAPPPTPEPTLADRIENMVAQFGKGGVTREQMETRLGRASSDWTADDVADMTAVFQSLKAKETTVAEEFPGGGS